MDLAYCGADGQLLFGNQLPRGMLPVARCPADMDPINWRSKLESVCRRAYDGRSFLIPGIPECREEDGQIDQEAALRALMAFRSLVAEVTT